ncbi:MAG: hypothetical protein K1X79_12145 [Oligoflexia bacterium]|nr:hypothetical protein [Oligoflexia bacterium]
MRVSLWVVCLMAALLVFINSGTAFAGSLVTAQVITKRVQGGVAEFELKTRNGTLLIQTIPSSERARIFEQALDEQKLVYLSLSDEGDIQRVLLSLTSAAPETISDIGKE